MLVWTANHAGTIEKLCLGLITSRIAGIGGMRVGRRIERVCREVVEGKSQTVAYLLFVRESRGIQFGQ